MHLLLTRMLSSVAFASLICCGEKSVPPASKKKKSASRIFVRAQIISKESGLVKIRLQAPLIEEYNSSEKNKAHTIFPKGLNLYYYDYEKNKAQSTFLRADWGKAIEEEKLYEARGNVMITNSNKDMLRTSHIFWNRKKQRIYNEVPTEIRRADGTVINAKNGLEGSDNLKEVTLKNTDGLIHLYQDSAS